MINIAPVNICEQINKNIPKTSDEPLLPEDLDFLTEIKPTRNTPVRIRTIPVQWCRYCFAPRKIIDIMAVITTIRPLII